MKFANVVAMATAVVVSMLSGTVEAQSPVPGFISVRGPIGYTGRVVSRMPVQALATQKPDVFNMFLLALQDRQVVKQESDPGSYYGIAGIHGTPFIPWQETSSPSQDPTRGYCTHNSVLFATWHRPYLALFEERLTKSATEIAAKFTDPAMKAKYVEAAKNVRLPYWDWAATDLRARQPNQLKVSTVTVIRPRASDGVAETVTLPNPLLQYRFKNNAFRAQYFDSQFQNSIYTRRQPPLDMSSSNQAAVDSAMNLEYSSRRTSVYNLFSIPSFSDFAGTQLNTDGSPNGWDSVESVHNGVHVNVGGQYGHMTAVPYSSFDPIFWLHHCNIDRLIAMYQAVYPGRVVEPRPASGTFARIVDSSSLDTLTTPLAPFRHPNGVYFTSKDVSTTDQMWNLGYAYDEVPVSYRGNPSGLSTFTRSRINALYRDATSGTTVKRGIVDHKRREWLCHMKFDVSEVESSCAVKIYFDKDPKASPSGTGYIPKPTEAPRYANTTTYSNSSSCISPDAYYVGSAAALRDPNSKMAMKMDVTGAVWLSDALLDAGCPSLDPKDVVPFLKARLRWVVKLGGEKEVPLYKVPSLKVGVSSTEFDYPASDTELPSYGAFETHYDVTENKKGGFTHRDEKLVDSKPAPPVPDCQGSEPTMSEKPTYAAPSSTKSEDPTYAAPSSTKSEDPTYAAPSSTAPCSSSKIGNDGVTTIVVTSTTTVCPCEPTAVVTTAFTSVYSTASLPPYRVY